MLRSWCFREFGMRVITFVLLAVTIVQGQEAARPGIVRGALLQVGSTSLVVTTSGGDPVQCGFDGHTYMEKMDNGSSRGHCT